MNRIGMENVEGKEASIIITDTGGELTLKIMGEIDMDYSSMILKPYISEFHEKISRAGIERIRLDLSELNFINSSGLKVFFWWMRLLDELPDDKNYSIALYYSTDITWQECNVEIMQDLAPRLLELVTAPSRS